MPSVRLDDQPTTATESYGRWQPLNDPLGISAFGVNGFVADPGEEIDNAHDESDSGQQELYVVVSGHARFELDGETIDAPAGTVVSAPDPASRRGFTAQEPGTRIVCIGAPQGAAQPYGEWIADSAAS
jgi:uncharacterized cupin superfamily protein